MNINDEIDMENLKYEVKTLKEKNEELQVEIDILKEQLILTDVSQRSELLIDFFIKQHQNLHRFNELVEPENIVDEYLKGNL